MSDSKTTRELANEIGKLFESTGAPALAEALKTLADLVSDIDSETLPPSVIAARAEQLKQHASAEELRALTDRDWRTAAIYTSRLTRHVAKEATELISQMKDVREGLADSNDEERREILQGIGEILTEIDSAVDDPETQLDPERSAVISAFLEYVVDEESHNGTH